MQISWYDVVIVAMLLFAVFRGARRGLVWQLAAISAIVLCFTFAETLSITLAPILPGLQPPLNRWVAMFLIYLGCSFVSFAAARVLREWIEKAKLDEFDRHLGAVFGLIKGVIFCLVVTFFVVTLAENLRSTVLASYSGKAAGFIMNRLHPVMPDELHKVLEPYLDEIDPHHADLHLADGDHHGHDHGDGHDDDIFVPDFFDEFSNSQSSGSSSNGTSSFNTAKIISSLSSELQRLATTALANTAPQDQPELLNKISTQYPDVIRNTLLAWQKGKPYSQAPNYEQAPSYQQLPSPPTTASSSSEQNRLLEEIAGVYSDFPQGRTEIISEIKRSISGVPDNVALAVLQDWHSDLLYRKPDPDPSTSLSTPVEERIVRQLKRAGNSSPSIGGFDGSSNDTFR